jgi:D-glycero-D-manno-heptose 1,7-bisphosphate phosphatase
MKGAVFLDRDGVIIRDSGYVSSAEDVAILDGVKEGISILKLLGFPLVVVTNQSGIARGYYTVEDYHKVTNKMLFLFGKENVFDLILFSPFHADGIVEKYSKDSNCRKPAPGMFLKAKEKLDIDFSASWMIGDKKSDIEAGKKLGIKTILVNSCDIKASKLADFVCENLLEASRLIKLKTEN